MKVLVNEAIAQAGIDALAERFDVTAMPGWEREELRERIGEFAGVVVRSATKLDADLVGQATRLRVIGRAGVGVDNVDLGAASARGIIVVNAPTSTVRSVAEHAIGLMLALARNVARGDASLRAGRWDRSQLGGIELHGRTLVLLGVGRIGREVGERARAFGMRVVGYDPFVTPEGLLRMGFEHAATIDEALAQADVVSLHMPLTPDTRGLLDAARLGALRPGARIINTARGALIDLDALHAAIVAGRVAGAALDVFPTEPPPPHPLFERAEVLLTPHLAASTGEAQDRAGIAVAEQVSAALTGGVVTSAVNVPRVAPEVVEALQPWAPLASRLARLACAAAGGSPRAVRISTTGSVAEWEPSMLGWSALVGLLSGTTEEPVSVVNAHSLAAERGIDVTSVAEASMADERSALTVQVTGADRTATMTGTLFGDDARPWLTGALGFSVETELSGTVLLLEYGDVPGVVGRVGTQLGDAGVNIASMAVARCEGDALMAVVTDSAVPGAIVDALSDIDGMRLAVATGA